MRTILTASLPIFCLLANTNPASAQNTGGVFGPIVNDDHRAIQYRITHDPDADLYAHRFHAEASLNDRVMGRIVVQNRGQWEEDQRFDFVQGEVFLELTDQDATVKQGLRFDARVRGDDRPGLAAASYMFQLDPIQNVEFRALVLTAVDIGPDARDGVFVETRHHLVWKGPRQIRLGVESFNGYGTTADEFTSRKHQVGPFAMLPVGNDWSLFLGTLVGVSDAAPDNNLRLWINKNF